MLEAPAGASHLPARGVKKSGRMPLSVSRAARSDTESTSLSDRECASLGDLERASPSGRAATEWEGATPFVMPPDRLETPLTSPGRRNPPALSPAALSPRTPATPPEARSPPPVFYLNALCEEFAARQDLAREVAELKAHMNVEVEAIVAQLDLVLQKLSTLQSSCLASGPGGGAAAQARGGDLQRRQAPAPSPTHNTRAAAAEPHRWSAYAEAAAASAAARLWTPGVWHAWAAGGFPSHGGAPVAQRKGDRVHVLAAPLQLGWCWW